MDRGQSIPPRLMNINTNNSNDKTYLTLRWNRSLQKFLQPLLSLYDYYLYRSRVTRSYKKVFQ
jgi:hypothetical protein